MRILLFLAALSQISPSNPPGELADRVYVEAPCAWATSEVVGWSVATSTATVRRNLAGTTCVLKFYSQTLDGELPSSLNAIRGLARRTAAQQAERVRSGGWE